MQKADFPGGSRVRATGFSIGEKGFIGTGVDLTGYRTNDYWEYDPVTDKWLKPADFEETGRVNGSGISIGRKVYIGFGYSAEEMKNDWWEYLPDIVLPLHLLSFTATLQKTSAALNCADMQGRHACTAIVNAAAGTVDKDIDISKLAIGMYNIQLISNQGTSKSSFVKE